MIVTLVGVVRLMGEGVQVITKLSDCYMLNCKHNDGNGCTLASVTLNCDGNCMEMGFTNG